MASPGDPPTSRVAPAPFEFAFAPRTPSGRLGRFVESLWHARGTVPYAREKIAPTGSTVAVFVLGDPIEVAANDGRAAPLRTARGFLIGPHDRPIVNAPTGETFAVGIVTTPVGCESVFGVSPRKLRGRAVELEGVWSYATELRAELANAPGPEARLALLEERLTERVRGVGGVARCAEAVALLEADPARPVADIAAALGISHGHLCREHARVVGLTPRGLASLLRLRRILPNLDVGAPIEWSRVASEGGWFDQAHFIRDFKRYTGVTPSRYVIAQRAAYGDAPGRQGAGFVPES